MLFDLYVVVINFAVKCAHNFIASVFRWLLFLVRLRLYSLSDYASESLDDESNSFCLLCLQRFFFLYIFFLISFLSLLYFDKLYFFNDESDNDGSGSCSPGTCNFPFCSGNSVSHVRGVGPVVFVPTGIESIGDVVPLVMFLPIVVESKVGRLIELFWRPKS